MQTTLGGACVPSLALYKVVLSSRMAEIRILVRQSRHLASSFAFCFVCLREVWACACECASAYMGSLRCK